ncbi:MAG: Crp/Fnr family transcriptional regulator [Anaerolineaceae bacterium]|nr:Crp/Fnr family transcriptional regulator [Anaerolineaceae bacterium]
MENFQSLQKRMHKLKPFKFLSSNDLMTIINSGQIKRVLAGKRLFHEGEACSGLFVLFSGEVHLYKTGPGGQENILSYIKPVIMFNEIAVLDGGVNPVSAQAYKNCVVWRTDKDTFQNGLEHFPSLGLGLLPIISRRNRQLIKQYSDLAFRSVRERLALLLLDISDHGEIVVDRETYSIQQMASLISTVPVVISRWLGTFREEGYIETTRNEIVVINSDGLSNLVYLNVK